MFVVCFDISRRAMSTPTAGSLPVDSRQCSFSSMVSDPLEVVGLVCSKYGHGAVVSQVQRPLLARVGQPYNTEIL